MSKTTIKLNDYIRSELRKQGFNEIKNESGELVYFDKDSQFMTKILTYDEDVAQIMDRLFQFHQLDNPTSDYHFKKTFLLRFANREINRQTIDSFQYQLIATFLNQQKALNHLYAEIDSYFTGSTESTQENHQTTDGNTLNDSRNASQDLAQDEVNLDLDNTVMNYANDTSVTRSKQENQQTNQGNTHNETKQYQMDNFIQSSQVFEQIFQLFDKKCFMQF